MVPDTFRLRNELQTIAPDIEQITQYSQTSKHAVWLGSARLVNTLNRLCIHLAFLTLTLTLALCLLLLADIAAWQFWNSEQYITNRIQLGIAG